MTFTVLRNSCTLYTFTVLRQKALTFTLTPPYVRFGLVCPRLPRGAGRAKLISPRGEACARKFRGRST